MKEEADAKIIVLDYADAEVVVHTDEPVTGEELQRLRRELEVGGYRVCRCWRASIVYPEHGETIVCEELFDVGEGAPILTYHVVDSYKYYKYDTMLLNFTPKDPFKEVLEEGVRCEQDGG